MARGLRGALAVALALLLAPSAWGAAPGAPGAPANWTDGDKDGLGSATALASKVLFTLDDGAMTEVYYPDLGTPAVRDLQFAVSDGRTFTDSERDDATHALRLADRRSLTYRQVSTARSKRWRITKTYVADPARSAVLVDVEFESLTGEPLQLYALLDPALTNTGDDDRGAGLTAFDDRNAGALRSDPAPRRTSVGYKGTSDGWTDIAGDHRMDWTYEAAREPGNVVQIAQLPSTGLRGDRDVTLALGFGADGAAAARTAERSLGTGFRAAEARYSDGWDDYLDGLDRRPRSVDGMETTYDVSLMVMAALEDKTYRGGGIASPSMAWVWGNLGAYSGPYHLVWSRDLYQVATAQMAAGDRAGAERAVDYLWDRQQQPDGCFPQNSNLDGSPHWPNLQLDEVAYPVVLSWQLGRFDARTWSHVRRAADCIETRGPASQERWENADGYSPATIAASIAGFVTAAEIADRNGARADAARYRHLADKWQASVDTWTRTTNGPLSQRPYYLRLTKDGRANAGTTYTIGDGGPTVDQRSVVDPSFLELVRFGVKRADDADIRSTIPVVDRELGVTTPNGEFWHRYNHDGYGETPDGGPFPGPGNTGRLWPIFAGERGEYELARDGAGARGAARARLRAIAATGNDGFMLPEQVWDENPPSGGPGFPRGEGTFSATPLAWTHAQFVRLAHSTDAGRPVERPHVVACRYAGECRR